MKVLWKCCIRALKENKGRTMVTIIGVAMATVLITTLSCMASSILESVSRYLQITQGRAHETYMGIRGEDLKYFVNNQSIDEIWMEKRLARKELTGNKDTYNYYLWDLYAAKEDWFTAQGLKLTNGRMPENDHEIVIPKAVRRDLSIELNVHDKLTFQIAGAEEEFEIVGFYTHDNGGLELDEYYDENYDGFYDEKEQKHYSIMKAFTKWDGKTSNDEVYDVSIHFTKAGLLKREEISAAILGVSTETFRETYTAYGVRNYKLLDKERLFGRAEMFLPNEALEEWDSISPFHLTQTTVWAISFGEVIFLIFVLAGVFCINNSFDISITQRVRFYGMISSVGSTKRQRRMLVWMEAFVIAAIGIPMGILMGIGLSAFLVFGTNLVLKAVLKSVTFSMIFRPAWWAILIAAVQAIFMIVLSAMEAAFRAARITPIEAIRSNDTIQSKRRRHKTPKTLKRLFGVGGGIAWQNFKRSKIKYRATIISITVSVALVLGMTFIPFLFRYVEYEVMGIADYQVEIAIYDSAGYEKIKEIASDPIVTEGLIYRGAEIIYRVDPDREENDQWVYAFNLFAWEDEIFEKLCLENGLDPRKMHGKGLITEANKSQALGETYNVEKRSNEEISQKLPGIPFSVEIGGVIDSKTISAVTGLSLEIEFRINPARDVYVSESWAKEHLELFRGYAYGYFQSKDVTQFIENIEKENYLGISIYNFDQIYQTAKLAKALVTMFMVGFIGLILLIGVTNVINAVNFNMEMRAPEFAKLRAVGMTGKQFKGMIFTEGLFVGAKGLLWGYFIGCGIYYMLWRSFAGSADMLWEDPYKKVKFAFQIPVLQMAGCAVVVGLLLFAVMNRHARRAQERNVIETIRNENL